jgi:hypothetical protein
MSEEQQRYHKVYADGICVYAGFDLSEAARIFFAQCRKVEVKRIVHFVDGEEVDSMGAYALKTEE